MSGRGGPVEIVRIRVEGRPPEPLACRDVVTGAVLHVRELAAEVGAELVCELRGAGPERVATRVVSGEGGVRRPLPRRAAAAVRAVDLVPGQVRVAEVPFSSYRTAERDAGCLSKTRPVVVIDVGTGHVAVRPILGSNSAARRTGQARRLRGWRSIPLKKPSVVEFEVLDLDPARLGQMIGVLAPVDDWVLAL